MPINYIIRNIIIIWVIVKLDKIASIRNSFFP